MPDHGRRLARPRVTAFVGLVVGTGTMAAAEVWVTPTPTWLSTLDLCAGLALVAAGAALVAARATAPGWLLLAAGMAWAATTAGLGMGGVNTALLVTAAMTSDLRQSRRARRAALALASAAWLCAVPVVNDQGWPWLVVAAGAVASTRRHWAWLVVTPLSMLLALRAAVGLAGTVAQGQRTGVLVAYGVIVMAIAAGSVIVGKLGRPRKDQVVRQVALSEGGELEQLRRVLTEAVRDPDLALSLDAGELTITSDVLEGDPDLATAVDEVVRLLAANRDLREALDRQLHELRSSSSRLLAAADGQAEALSTRLLLGPRRRLARVAPLLGEVREPDTLVDQRLSQALAHLDRADSGLAALGGGRLPSLTTAAELSLAITELAEALHESVEVDVDVGVGSAVVGTTIYFVCAEALSNAAKHAAAQRVAITVLASAPGIVVTVTDDGIGGAEPDGPGLQGIATRVAALGGQLRVDSPDGLGTTVRAMVPT